MAFLEVIITVLVLAQAFLLCAGKEQEEEDESPSKPTSKTTSKTQSQSQSQSKSHLEGTTGDDDATSYASEEGEEEETELSEDDRSDASSVHNVEVDRKVEPVAVQKIDYSLKPDDLEKQRSCFERLRREEYTARCIYQMAKEDDSHLKRYSHLEKAEKQRIRGNVDDVKGCQALPVQKREVELPCKFPASDKPQKVCEKRNPKPGGKRIAEPCCSSKTPPPGAFNLRVMNPARSFTRKLPGDLACDPKPVPKCGKESLV